MEKSKSQLPNTLMIIIGGALLIYTFTDENANQYLKIGGLIIIMFGLYRATNHWVETKDDHKDDNDANTLN